MTDAPPIFVRMTPGGRVADFGGSLLAWRSYAEAERFSRAAAVSFGEAPCVVGSVDLDELAAGIADAEGCELADARQMIRVEPDARCLHALFELEQVMRGDSCDAETARRIDDELDLTAVAYRHALRLRRLADISTDAARLQLIRVERVAVLADRLDATDYNEGNRAEPE